jgi:hypothetical protein
MKWLRLMALITVCQVTCRVRVRPEVRRKTKDGCSILATAFTGCFDAADPGGGYDPLETQYLAGCCDPVRTYLSYMATNVIVLNLIILQSDYPSI